MKTHLITKILVAAVIVLAGMAAFQMATKGRLDNGIDTSAGTSTAASSTDPVNNEGQASAVPATKFAWDIKVAAKNDMPESQVYLVTTYSDGSASTTLVATVVGECNTEDVTTKLALGSKQLTCYYAGLGHKIRVIDTGADYSAQVKVFEEALPDYNPPAEDFKTVATIKKNK